MKMLKKITMVVDFTKGCARHTISVDGRRVYSKKLDRSSSVGIQKMITAMVAGLEVIQDPTMGPAVLEALASVRPIIMGLNTDAARDLAAVVEFPSTRKPRKPRVIKTPTPAEPITP